MSDNILSNQSHINMSNAITKIYNKKWSMFNNFTVQFTFPQGSGGVSGTVASLAENLGGNLGNIAKMFGKASSYVGSSGYPFDVSEIASENINLHIISITTPDISNSTIDNFIGNKWFAGNGRPEMQRFSITFRDSDQMSLYSAFYNLYRDNCEQYFDETAFDVLIYKDADWSGERGKKKFSYEKTIIDNISNVSFNNTSDAQIVEFTVNFKCVNPRIF